MVIVVNLVKQTWFFCMMLPLCVIVCMLDHYQAFLPLAAIIAARLHCMLVTIRCKHSRGISAHLPSAWLGGAPQGSWACCPYWWLQSPIHVLWGYNLAILQAAPSWWRCPADENQGLPKHNEVKCYRLGSGSYPQNAAWQIALRCFSKYPCRPHRWGICWDAAEAIWHQCEKFPRHIPKHHQLGPYKTGTFAGSALQVNIVP